MRRATAPLPPRYGSARIVLRLAAAALIAAAFLPLPASAQSVKGKAKGKGGLPINEADARNIETGKPEPERDPELIRYGIYASDAPRPERVEPAETRLPLDLREGDRIAFVGNTLLDREGRHGFFQSMLYQARPGLELSTRILAWSADEVDLQPRPDNFATLSQHLRHERADVVFAAFGFNESFAGEERLGEFRGRLRAFLVDLNTSAFNGESGPRIVLVSPTANENLPGTPAADLNNERLALYTAAMAEVAAVEGVGFADVFTPTRSWEGGPARPEEAMTLNGVHLTEAGYAVFAEALYRAVFEESPPAVDATLREAVLDKNLQYFRRYRPLNTFYYTGGRSTDYGYLDFLPAMRNFDLMVAAREARIHALARGEEAPPPDDSALPPLDAVAEGRGANEWLSPEEELASFQVDERFEVTLFASEVEFPEIACPIQIRFDGRGRMWVSCSTTYPHVYPGQEPDDKLVILEDRTGDGRADTSTVFADDLHIPLSFELLGNGVYVSEQPHLTLLEDLTGDDRADRRTELLTGFGVEDSHHSIHDMVWTPDGDLLFREAIFHHSQVETPYGPVRARNSAWFRYTPSNQRLVSFGSYPNTNPWGVTFDDWGHHVASHPIFAASFHSLNPPYPEQQPRAQGIPAYSGTCGHEFIDFPQWPEEMQGGFVKARYKPDNRIEFHRWTRQEDHWAEEFAFNLIFSTNLSFIPVDVQFGPDGALYVCDWYNPVKGHMQYSLRDPRRDRHSGRIWRIVPKGFEPQEAPPIAGAPVEQLLANLERREYRYRYWSKRELQARPAAEVVPALDAWFAGLNPDAERYRHHQLEAVWAARRIGELRTDWLDELLACEIPDARAAATQQLRHWAGAYPDGGLSRLARAAADEDAIVRTEAVIAASYLGSAAALEAVAPVFDLPMGDHLAYAARCALISETLRPHWRGDTVFLERHPAMKAFVESWDDAPTAPATEELSEEDRAFDALDGLALVEIGCLPERLLFDTERFTVRAGQPVKLVFHNPDLTPHNLVIVEPGALEEVGLAGNEMAKDPEGFAKGYIPESERILHHTRLLQLDQTETLRFRAPEEPGVYPYVCTFPGHWIIMKGEMVVESAGE